MPKANKKSKKNVLPESVRQEAIQKAMATPVGGDALNGRHFGEGGVGEGGMEPGMPKMTFEIPDEVKPGLAIMNQITQMISSGRPIDPETQGQVVRFLQDLQAKADLIQVAQIPLALGRLARITTLAGKAEQRLEDILDSHIPLDAKEASSILKALYTERAAIQEMLTQASTKPTISSPDAIGRTMESGAVQPSTSTETALPNLESRRRVSAMFEQVRAKAKADFARNGAIDIQAEPTT